MDLSFFYAKTAPATQKLSTSLKILWEIEDLASSKDMVELICYSVQKVGIHGFRSHLKGIMLLILCSHLKVSWSGMEQEFCELTIIR